MTQPASIDLLNPAPGPSSSPGGRACTNCARVKCKCIPRPDGIGCERCHRLKKECTPTGVVRRRIPKRKDASRVARVEEKLDQLVSYLKTHEEPDDSNPGDVDDAKAQDEPGFRTDTPADSVMSSASTTSHHDVTSSSLAVTPASSICYADEPSDSEAEESLKKFREERIPYFPCVYIPPHVTSEQLRQAYPFLWLNVMMTTAATPRRGEVLAEQARAIIFQKVVIDREKSIDLLMGMLTFLGWCPSHKKSNKYVTLFSQLIVTLVFDMGLHIPPPEHAFIPCGPSKGCNCSLHPYTRRRRTDEERRTVLGAFVITSMLSYAFNRSDGLRWSSHLDEYVASLSHDSTVLQDKHLIAQVKMQLIINQIHHASWPTTGAELPALYLSALRSQLQQITKGMNVSPDVGNPPMLSKLFHFTDLLIYQSAISTPTSPWSNPDFRRFEVYQGCLDAIKGWLDAFFAIPVAQYGSMPIIVYPPLVLTLCSLYNLTILQDPAWDRAAVRGIVDLIPTCDRIIAAFDSLGPGASSTSPDNVGYEGYTWCLGVMNAKRMKWQKDLETIDAAGSATQEASFVGGTDSIASNAPMEFCVDMWLSEFLNTSWE